MTSDVEEDYAVTHDHMRAFGAIMQAFARHEMMLQIVAAGLLRAPVAGVMALTANLGYAAKRDAMLSVVALSSVPPEQAERIDDMTNALDGYSALRNSIAHHVWTRGSRPGSIKPMYIRVRNRSTKLFGLMDDERDYTCDELETIADEISVLYDNFRRDPVIVELWKVVEEVNPGIGFMPPA